MNFITNCTNSPGASNWTKWPVFKNSSVACGKIFRIFSNSPGFLETSKLLNACLRGRFCENWSRCSTTLTWDNRIWNLLWIKLALWIDACLWANDRENVKRAVQNYRRAHQHSIATWNFSIRNFVEKSKKISRNCACLNFESIKYNGQWPVVTHLPSPVRYKFNRMKSRVTLSGIKSIICLSAIALPSAAVTPNSIFTRRIAANISPIFLSAGLDVTGETSTITAFSTNSGCN